MKRTFIRTKNVKRFVGLMDELQKLPPNIPKLALVYGEHGLGKSQTIQWWVDKNDSVYVRANQGMTKILVPFTLNLFNVLTTSRSSSFGEVTIQTINGGFCKF